MNLKFTLPDKEGKRSAPCSEKKIVYCVPGDMTLDGQKAEGLWIVVTPARLFLLSGGEVTGTVSLQDVDEVVCSPQVACGLLLVKKGEEERLLCRFSMRHMVRYSYLARGATLFLPRCGTGGGKPGAGKALSCLRSGASRHQHMYPLRRL